MPKRKRGISQKLLSLAILPTILLSTLIITCGILLLFHFYSDSIHDELASTTNMMTNCLEIAVRGDYAYENGMLLKGDVNITDSTMLFRVKEESEIDTTIFWGDTRILTTVENDYGVSAVGTTASEEVAEAVLVEGRDYFSNRLNINGTRYIGYYMPIRNSDRSVVGMMFAGKSASRVYKKIGTIIFLFFAFSVAAVTISGLITKRFSSKMVLDINIINQFLQTISEGNLRAVLDERITNRDDELGSIGLYASKMRSELQKLIEMDALTSLYNRRSGHSILRSIVKNNENYCVIMCDIDWFKKINDGYGHDAGDYVLTEISKLLKSNVEGAGYASRWGGEEFLLVYELEFQETVKKAEELQKSIREHSFIYGETPISVTMTFGVEEGNLKESYEHVIKRADEKLYVGKNNGRNQVVS